MNKLVGVHAILRVHTGKGGYERTVISILRHERNAGDKFQ